MTMVVVTRVLLAMMVEKEFLLVLLGVGGVVVELEELVVMHMEPIIIIMEVMAELVSIAKMMLSS